MPPSTTSQDISTTTHHQLKFTHHHSRPPTESQNVYSNSDRKRYVLCCKRKVAAVKIEKLKVFIFKCSDFSKTYSVQFHLFGSVNLSYFYFFIHGFQSSTLDKLKNTLNGRLKLNKANNRS